jgi:hypothetical protein
MHQTARALRLSTTVPSTIFALAVFLGSTKQWLALVSSFPQRKREWAEFSDAEALP